MGSNGIVVSLVILSLNIFLFTPLVYANLSHKTPPSHPKTPPHFSTSPPSHMPLPPYLMASPPNMPPMKQPNCQLENFGVCENLLNMETVVIEPETMPCCQLINDLSDLDAPVCICSALKENILGPVPPNLTISVEKILNRCGRALPTDYKCCG